MGHHAMVHKWHVVSLFIITISNRFLTMQMTFSVIIIYFIII